MPKYKACKICGRLATEPFTTLSKYEGVILCDYCRIIKIVNKSESVALPIILEINRVFSEDAATKPEMVDTIEKLRQRVLDAVRAECHKQLDK